MSKFVGKFRKNQNYNDDYNYTPNTPKRQHRNEHSEIKKLKNQNYDEFVKNNEEMLSLPQKK